MSLSLSAMGLPPRRLHASTKEKVIPLCPVSSEAEVIYVATTLELRGPSYSSVCLELCTHNQCSDDHLCEEAGGERVQGTATRLCHSVRPEARGQ